MEQIDAIRVMYEHRLKALKNRLAYATKWEQRKIEKNIEYVEHFYG